MLIDLIAGARPNFVKIAPIIDAIKKKQFEGTNIKFRLIHTGQHYDKNMSENFFLQLGIPEPDFNLNAGGGTQAEQTAKIMIEYEKILTNKKSFLCLVVGDVTSTMACTITAKKMNILVAHVEGGIRSGDMNMPEEINRIVTDSISDYFFTTSSKANLNLIKTGVLQEKIFFVGNTMIDTLLKQRPNFIKPKIWDKNSLKLNQFIVLTLHRPSNVDNHDNLKNILKEIIIHSGNVKIIFPLHPRTKIIFEELNIKSDKLIVIEPLPYLEFNYLVDRSKAVITDSGGITEETTVLGVPCMTLRDSTERPETVEMGTNELIGSDYRLIKPAFEKLNSGNWKTGIIPPLWDGSSAERIIDLILHIIKLK